MTQAQFERRDKSDQNGLIPPISEETFLEVLEEFQALAARYNDESKVVNSKLEQIRRQNPIVANWIENLSNFGMQSESCKNAKALAGVKVYRLLEKEFEKSGKKMPRVSSDTHASLMLAFGIHCAISGSEQKSFFDELFMSLRQSKPLLLQLLSQDADRVDQIEMNNPSVLNSAVLCGIAVYSLIEREVEAQMMLG